MMIVSILLLVAGLVLLVKSSDFLVESAAKIAHYLGVSELIIGLTLIAIGTSLPELGSSMIAISNGNPGIVTGNIIGSNIANIGLVLGVAALISTLKIKPEMFKRDAAMMIGVTALFLYFVFDGTLSRGEGMVLLLLFIAYTAYLFKYKPKFNRFYKFGKYFREKFEFGKLGTTDFYKKLSQGEVNLPKLINIIDDIIDFIPDDLILRLWDVRTYKRISKKMRNKLKEGIVREFIIIGISGLGIILGANYFIKGAVELASFLGVSDVIIGLTIIAVGTSLPELTVVLTSAKKGYGNILIGNIIGSNIGNITLIGGLSAVITDLPINGQTIQYTLAAMLTFTIVSLIFIRSDEQITKKEGLLLIAGYALFMASIVLS